MNRFFAIFAAVLTLLAASGNGQAVPLADLFDSEEVAVGLMMFTDWLIVYDEEDASPSLLDTIDVVVVDCPNSGLTFISDGEWIVVGIEAEIMCQYREQSEGDATVTNGASLEIKDYCLETDYGKIFVGVDSFVEAPTQHDEPLDRTSVSDWSLFQRLKILIFSNSCLQLK